MTSLVAVLLAAWAAGAQPSPATIAGRLQSGSPAAPVAGATVRAEGVFAESDGDGRFALTVPAVASSTVLITVTAPGHVEEQFAVTLAGDRTEVDVLLQRSPTYREDVVVSGRTADVTAAPPTIVLQPLTVSRVAGSGDNVFRVLQTMPGVSATDDFGSRLAVRGGGPDQNLTVMDGVEIHNPYRLFGLTSAFNPETIDRFELTAGGFGAKYGDRLSSILLVDNRAGTSSERFAGSAALSATDANVVLEGALPSGSWLVTGRRTYYDVFAERFTDSDLPSFEDVQAKAAWEPGPGTRMTFFALRSRESTDASFDGNQAGDRFGLTDASRNDVVSLSLLSSVGSRATLKTTGAWYRYEDALGVDGSIRNDAIRSNAPGDDNSYARASIVFTRSLGVQDYSVRQDLTVGLTPAQALTVGVDAHALNTDWGWTIAGDRNTSAANGSSVRGGSGLPDLLNSSASSARVGAYAEDDLHVTARLRVAAGGRLDWSRLAAETIMSPRLRATFDLTARTKIRASAGLYTQSPGYEKLLQSDYFVDLSNTNSLGLKSERAVHIIGGLEHQFGPSVSGRIEGYRKTFARAIAGQLEAPEATAQRVAQYAFPVELRSSVPTAPQITTLPGNSGSGYAYGLDVYLEKRATTTRTRLSGWLAYTWGRALLDGYGQRYPFDYDRRHALSLVSTVRVLPRIEIGATLRVASGFPFTPPVGVRVDSTLADGAVPGAPGSLVPRRDASGQLLWTTDFGSVENLNSGRLPLFARLDLRVTYKRSPTSRWQWYIETINALNRDNAGSLTPRLQYDPSSDRPRVTLSSEGGLPLLPSFGLRIRL